MLFQVEISNTEKRGSRNASGNLPLPVGIDLVCYAIMSNHFHLILRSRPDFVTATPP
jgi:hypothetical protein